MASVFNAARNISSDGLWLVKLLILSVPTFFIMNEEGLWGTLLGENLPILIALIVFYLGCASVMMNRNINNTTPIMPGVFNIPEVIIKGFGVTICGLVGSVILFFACNLLNTYIVLDNGLATFILNLCVVSFMAPFIFIPMVLYSVNGKIQDAMKVGKVFEASGNFVVAFLSFILQFAFLIGLFTYLSYKLFFEMFGGYSTAIAVLYAFIAVLSFFLFFSYISDLYEDVIPSVKSKRDVL